MPQVVLLRQRRKRAFLVIAVVVVMAAIAVLVFAVQYRARGAALQHDRVVSEANKLDTQKNFAAEETLLTGYINSKPPKQYRRDVLLRLGQLALNSQRYPAAAKWFLQAYNLTGKPDLEEATGLARAAAGEGDKADAIRYYQQAIAQVPAQPQVDHDTRVNQLKNAILGLGSQP